MNDHLTGSQRYWDQHAASDPLWTVLAFPDKSGGRWTLQEFMKTGEREIALLFHRFAALQVKQPAGRALDFGCGVGRLTQALARRVERVVGADISPVMIELAAKLNRYPHKAEYICTAHAGLESLPAESFQLIYSNIVLQHVLPDVAVSCLHEFFRLLEPGGLLVFQLPSHRDSPVEAEIKPMPDEAYRADIQFAAALPSCVAASSELSVALKVRNASDHAWQQPHVGPLAVGNHWLDASGELMLVQDDGRAPLLQIVPPGLEWPVLMTIHTPAEPGKYVGEIDLVHEGVTWYGHKGSPKLRFTIDVTRSSTADTNARPAMIREYPIPDYPDDVLPKSSPTSAPPPQANFPMHGVPRETVMALINKYGGRLAYLEEDRRAGPEWVSYRYFVVGGTPA